MTNDIRVTPRLIVSSSAEAIDFYTHALGAEELSRYTTPEGVVVHAEIRVGASTLMLTDADPEHGNRDPKDLGGSSVLLSLRCDPDAVCARAVERGAEVIFPVADRFYGDRDGRLRDPFGHVWIVSKTIEQLSAEQIQKGVDEFPSS